MTRTGKKTLTLKKVACVADELNPGIVPSATQARSQEAREGLSKVEIRFFKEPTVAIDNLYFQYHLRKKCDTIPRQLNREADFHLDSTNLPLRRKLSCQDEGNFAMV